MGPLDHAIAIGAALDALEILVLRKLWWFQLGGGVSDRQWRDVLAILRVQRARLDHQALADDAASVGLTDLLDRAIADLS